MLQTPKSSIVCIEINISVLCPENFQKKSQAVHQPDYFHIKCYLKSTLPCGLKHNIFNRIIYSIKNIRQVVGGDCQSEKIFQTGI
jgi:hypothetical protein